MEDTAASLKLKGLHQAATHSDDSPFTSSLHQDAAIGICRICRGEGTPEEPLFYPCKCSGSIKYVHQECLMEWLSHSQKKHCELCKTSFRFTKLYAPDMPQSLPVHVFLGHMAKYLLRNMLVWLRAVVAISVWLCGLPYFMRSCWSFLFWVSDEGFSSSSIASRLDESSTAFELASSALGIHTCPASPLLEPLTTPASAIQAVADGSGQNLSEFLIRILLGGLGGAIFDSPDAASDTTGNLTAGFGSNTSGLESNRSSLLGDVTFLHNLTRNSSVNRTLIAILEGQIITVLVIICFILVILVRDYVVQQQPEINIRAAFAAPANPLPPQDQLDVRAEDVENLRGPDESDDETLDNGDLSGQVRDPDVSHDENQDAILDRPGHDDVNALVPESGHLTDSQDIPRQRLSVNEYLRIWRQANGDQRRILEAIEDEDLEDQLAYYAELTRRSLRDQERTSGGQDIPPYNPSFQPVSGQDRPESSGSTAGSSSRVAFAPEFNEEGLMGYPEASTLGSRKGKEKASVLTPSFETGESSQNSSLFDSARPRAISDGPQPRDSVNPLANNSWSFAALSSEPVSDGPAAGASDYGKPPFIRQVTPPPSSEAQSRYERASNSSTSQDEDATPDTVEGMAPAEDGQFGNPSPPPVVAALVAEDGSAQADELNLGIVERVTDFMYQDVHPEAEPEDAEDDDQEDPWVDIDVDDVAAADDVAQGEDMNAGPGAALDAEAVDDLEDFEGVMELIGMRGPIAGLFQNAIFCAVLVFMTIITCIFLPYNIGRVSVWILANPMRLIRLLFELSKLLQDAAVMVVGMVGWSVLNMIDILASPIGGALARQIFSARKTTWALWTTAGSRVVDYAFMDFPMSTSEMQNFSAISHGALLTVKDHMSDALNIIGNGFALVFGGSALETDLSLETVTFVLESAQRSALRISSMLMDPSSWVIDLSESEKGITFDPELAHWSGLDRFWAILAGYLTLFFIGAMYLKRGSPFSRGNIMQAWEAGIIDTLHQASGIMKVIMVISIEMLVFPLYCGLLLDGALLPLFENATFKSRMLFTYNYPLTSIFVHWFVGTGYMFHFALFVSMCRKIMRQGVLYFIRDPDDPEFHPIRDVLERNLMTQLRKILFSAFVYGALVIVCLGAVVWGLAYSTPNVLPIHYSSNEPVLEFPVDLLFYNFLMPLAVNFFKPGDGLHAMYTWWFRTCARNLRLTFFLFGDRRIDEEGILQLPEDSPYHNLPWYKTAFLELFELDEEYRVVPKTWQDLWEEGDAKPQTPLPETDMAALGRKKARLRESNQLEESGHFVRAPASDRIRIPKGRKVFLDVDESNKRQDGQRDSDLYGSDQYQMVYIPPNFRTRVSLFILFIWLFAAATGVGFTIIPLVFGRMLFKMFIPEDIRTNDIYAFSIGVYIIGSACWSGYHWRTILENMRRWGAAVQQNVVDGLAGNRIASVLAHGAKLAFTYFFLLVVFPLLISTTMELYLTIPLHTYMYPPTAAAIEASRAEGPGTTRHTVRVIQSWTLGLLYLKLCARIVTRLFFPSRLSAAVRTVLRRGWLHPDIGVLTRAFVIPGLLVSTLAIFGPPFITNVLLKYGIIPGPQPGLNEAAEAGRLVIMYRQSYPVVALAALLIKNLISLVGVFNGWTARIRDEAYLIGERLHNFGAAAAGARGVRGAWRAGGARL